MVSFSKLAVIAIAAVPALSVDIEFRRFGQMGCIDNDHIHEDTHLHNPHCKEFSDSEPAYHSFIVMPEDDMDDLNSKHCYATVFEDNDCKSEHTWSTPDFNDILGQCQNPAIAGRSVKITCEDRPQAPQPDIHQAIVTTTVSMTQTHWPEQSTSTLYLYPEASCNCDYPWDWNHPVEKRQNEKRQKPAFLPEGFSCEGVQKGEPYYVLCAQKAQEKR